MKIRFFKYNFFRQFILYSFTIFCGLGVYHGIARQKETMVMISAITASLIAITLVYQYLSYVIIDEKGITYHSFLKHYWLRWDEIGQTKVIKRWNGQLPWVVIIRSDAPQDLYKKKNAINRTGECITFAYSSKAVIAIEQYRDQVQNGEEIICEPIDKQAPDKSKPDIEVKTTAIKKRYFLPVCLLLAVGLLFSILIYLNEGLTPIGIISIVMLSVLPLFSVIYSWFFDIWSIKFIMNKHGVANKKHKQVYYLRWDEIEYIQVVRNNRSASRKTHMIGFSRTSINGAFLEDFHKGIKQNNPTFIGVQYRKSIIKKIQKYWDRPIGGIYHGKL